MNTRKALFAFLLGILLAAPAMAQIIDIANKPLTDENIALLRSESQKSRNTIIDENMILNAEEKAAFTPVYNAYTAAQQEINGRRVQILKEYSQTVKDMTGETAHDLSVRLFKEDGELIALKQKFLPDFEKAIGAKKTARFFQLDNRLAMVMNLQVASEMPIIP